MPDARLPDIVNELQCHPDDLPPFLFRTQYTGSQTTLNKSGRLLSSKQALTRDLTKDHVFKALVDGHLNWDSRFQGSPFASPFISLHDVRRADRFAERCLEWPREPSVTLLALRTDTFTDVKVWRATDLVKALGIRLPQKKQPYIEGEYLCLFSVPVAEGSLMKQWIQKDRLPKVGQYSPKNAFSMRVSDDSDALSWRNLAGVAMESLDEERRKKRQEKRAKEPYTGGHQGVGPDIERLIDRLQPMTLKDDNPV